MTTRLPSAPPILPGLAYIRPLGSGGFADVFLYEQDMPRRNVAVKVMPSDVRDPDLRRMFNAEADVLAHLSAHPCDRHRLPGRHLGRRPAVHRHGVLPRLARRSATASSASPSTRCSRSACGWRAPSSPRTAPASSTATSSRATSSSRPSARPVLADFGISSSLLRATADEVLAMSIPWSAPEVVAEQTAGTIASEVWSLGATVYSLLAGHSPFERRERGQNTKEQLRRRIARASYTADPARRRAGVAAGRARDAR